MKVSQAGNRYVLLTPTRNEEKYIPETIAAVVHQEIKPIQWIIIDDASTDRTPEIIAEAAQKYTWIKIVSRQGCHRHNFSSVVENYELGIKKLKTDDYDFIGLLDSDVRFAPDYFSQLMKRLQMNAEFGLVGGLVIDKGRNPRLPLNLQDIPGATQFYRRECFQALGRIIPVPEGGWDTLTCFQARMAGYKTKLFPDLKVEHLKPRNASQGLLFKRYFQFGMRDYAVGYHPVFEFIKCLVRLTEYPFIIGALCRWSGYCFYLLKRKKRIIPSDLLEFIRKEQLHRIKLSQLGSHI